jgi:hypothetical protein
MTNENEDNTNEEKRAHLRVILVNHFIRVTY